MGTDKQNSYAKNLGIQSPENYDIKTLAKMIDEAKGGTKTPYKPQQQVQATPITSSVVINKTERPHSYEIGKVGNRHKIYYADVKELQDMIAELKEAGLMEETDFESLQA